MKIMKNITIKYAIILSGLASIAPASAASSNDPALKALFDQAQFWHDKSHDNLAGESLKKVLMVDPENTQALYLMALWAQQGGQQNNAAQWRARLAKIDPQSHYLQDLDNAKQLKQIPQGTLELARQQARSGNITASLATWQTLFTGETPPAGLAAEYYMTMGSDKTLYPRALAELQRLVASEPDNISARVALGKMLTWREGTRRDGIEQLQSLAENNKDASDGLRQALLWLSPTAGDEPYFEDWIAKHPQDSDVQHHYRNTLGNTAKGAGYQALNQGNLDEARQQFEQTLQLNPQDPDALAGMGYIAQHSGDYASASQYLNRASNLGGKEASNRKQQADDALFYGTLSQAQQALKKGNYSEALSLTAPLIHADSPAAIDASLFRADVFRRSKDLSQAEQTLRDVLQRQPQNEPAKENLYYVLRDQNKREEAEALLRSLPASTQARLRPATRSGNPGDTFRQRAEQLVASGDTTRAIMLLRQGVTRYPDDPWLRLSLARTLQASGFNGEAATVMQPASQPGASPTSLYASALFASDVSAWPLAKMLLNRIPSSAQTAPMRSLARRINYNLQLATAEDYLSSGNQIAAANTLKALAIQPPDAPADAGKLARMLAESGDMTSAVSVVRSNIQKGIQGNAGDYADQITVLNQAGLNNEAQRLLADPSLQARSTPTQLAAMRNSHVINEADALRQQGNYAAAYDKLITALQADPQNTDLMFAMGRLYQSGKMNKEAGVVYDYLMTRDNATQEARIGAMNVALADNNVARASELARGLHNTQTPDTLLLLARLEEAKGNHQQALAYLRNARGKLLGQQSTNSDATPTINGVLLADNPFTRINRDPRGASDAVLPWMVSPSTAPDGHILPGILRPDLPRATAQTQTLRQVDDMMLQLDQQTSMWIQGGAEVRGRDGESGTSKLTEARTPLTWSTSPFGDSRFELTATPVMLSAGTATGDAWRRYGSNPLSNVGSNILSTLQNEKKAMEAMGDTDRATYFAAHPGAQAVYEMSDSDLKDYNMTDQDGLSNLKSLLGYDNGNVGRFLEASTHKANINEPGDVSTDSQTGNGVELSLALSGDHYRADIGTTPLGQNLSTVVGGIKFSPKLTDYLTLILTAERRAIKDSLLSYVGLEDKYSGKQWGRVTKNGGSAQLSYDNGDAGFYADLGGYSYLGDNVASNTSLNAGTGVYLRPYHDDYRQLQTGLSVSWMNYSKDLSYFTYGQGGYFSPQNYISVAFPVDYSQTFNSWKLRLGGSIGFQSYSQDGSDYFPTNSGWQQTLEDAVEQGFAKEARYSGSSQNGMGYNLRAGLDYNVNKDMSIGGQVGYDTFGSYNESTAGVFFRYMLGRN